MGANQMDAAAKIHRARTKSFNARIFIEVLSVLKFRETNSIIFTVLKDRVLKQKKGSLSDPLVYIKQNQLTLHEPGKYLVGRGLVAAGPHFHSVIVLPPSAVPSTAVPLI